MYFVGLERGWRHQSRSNAVLVHFTNWSGNQCVLEADPMNAGSDDAGE
jgi:hypothetical protein